ncbi:MAG: hypothetical protein QW778_00785 [Candidatus Micrarchaeaceae archaeon]
MLSVVAIGGNVLSEEPYALGSAVDAIYALSRRGSVVVTHGNGPQVGELSWEEHKSLGILTAQTCAEIGAKLEAKISRYMASKGLKPKVAVALTYVRVSGNDKAFKNPTKPIGKFYMTRSAKALSVRGLIVKKFANGYRRVVASPRPLSIINIGLISDLLSDGYIVIAGGGGGIPIKDGSFADAVIDKDLTSRLIASGLGADNLFILTDVDGAFIGYGTKNARLIGHATVAEMSLYLKKGEFGEGSMKPKVEAALGFVRDTHNVAVIGNMSKATDAIRFRGCTVISP